jgi:acetyl esterase/lipase
MNIAVVLLQTVDDQLPALGVIVYPVVTFKEKVRFKCDWKIFTQ